MLRLPTVFPFSDCRLPEYSIGSLTIRAAWIQLRLHEPWSHHGRMWIIEIHLEGMHRVSERSTMGFRLKGSDSHFSWAGEQESMFIEMGPFANLRML